MHPEAYAWVRQQIDRLPPRRVIVELGARDVNGSIRGLFAHTEHYTGVDIAPGPGVDIVADGATFQPDTAPDTVVCCETLEHTVGARAIVENALGMLAPGGVLLLTAGGEGRAAHSGVDGKALREGEYYRNVTEAELAAWLGAVEHRIVHDPQRGDLYAVAVKPEPGEASPERRVLFVWPSAVFATYDVARGVHGPLAAEGFALVDYRLYRRLDLMQRALDTYVPPGFYIDNGGAARLASEGMVHQALIHGCRWAFIISPLLLHPDSLWALRRVGVRIALWFTEAPYDSSNEDEKELYLAQFVDVAFTNDRSAVPVFQRVLDRAGLGGIAVYLPHSYDPAKHRPAPDAVPEQYQADVFFLGTGFEERVELLAQIDWTGIDLQLGGLWPSVKPEHPLWRYLRWGCLPNVEVVRHYHGARIVLNPHRAAAGAWSANPRTYEVAACGAFQIADERPEIAELFGEAVPTYPPGDTRQLEALIRRYLADEPERRRLAALARERVQGQTFAERAKVIVQVLAEADRQAGRNVPRLVRVG